MKQKAIDAVIEELKKDILSGDCTVLEELLKRIPTDTLIMSLPEEQWPDYTFENNYFQIVSQGYNPEALREEIQVHCGNNGNIFITKTDEGFVVDVYGQQEFNNTMTIWEDDLTDDEIEYNLN